VKAVGHTAERCPLDRHAQYLETLRKSAAAEDH
jgi:hypothetical protein